MKDFKVYNFGNENYPKPIEQNKYAENTFVSFGNDNLYPQKLLKLFNESPTHGSIVKQKAAYIIGSGLQINNKQLDIMVNPEDSLSSFVKKCVIDYLVHGYYCVEVTFNIFNQPLEYFHIPAHQARWNYSKSKIWVYEDWSYRKNLTVYDRYTVNKNSDSTSKLFLFTDYNPSSNIVYPTPEYLNVIKAIETDISILEFNLNQVKKHFSPSSIISVFQGQNIPNEVKEKISDDIEEKFMGENGKKFIIEFLNDNSPTTKVQQLSANDWTAALLQTHEQTINNILKGHSINNGMLFGHSTAGKLGGSNELEQAYHQFKVNYCENKRNELENSFNSLFTGFDEIQGKLEFVDKSPVVKDIKPETLEKIYTVNELRALKNLPAIANGDRLIAEIQPAKAEAVPVQNEVQDSSEVKKKSSKKLNENDYELVKHLGSSIEDFDIIDDKITRFAAYQFDKESDIADYLIANDIKGLTASELINIIEDETSYKVSKKELNNIFKNLKDAGIANVEINESNRIKVTPLPKPQIEPSRKVQIMYKYIKKPNVSGGDLVPESRDFCVKLITNNRLYTRSEIQEMSNIFSYSIYVYAGGYFHNAETGETTPSCRHQWQPLQVIKKDK